MSNIKHLLYLLSLISTTFYFTDSYIYSKIDGVFKNDMIIKIDISFTRFTGILLRGSDTMGNRFSIENKDSLQNSEKIEFQFNDITQKIGVKRYSYFVYRFKADLDIKGNGLHMVNYDKTRYTFTGIFDHTPKPEIMVQCGDTPDSLKVNQTCIWMENMSSWNSKDSKMKNRVTICVHNFYINIKQLNWLTSAKSVSMECSPIIKETVCSQKQCYTQTVSDNIFNCSFSALNVREYCNKDLTSLSNKWKFYERVNIEEEESNKMRLAWKVSSSKNYSLMEVEFVRGSKILFHTQENNTLMMLYKNLSSTQYNTKILGEIYLNKIQILLIYFEFPGLILKFFNGEFIKTYHEIFSDTLKKITIGFSPSFDTFQKFAENAAFRYDSSKMKPFIPECIKEFPKQLEKKEKYFYLITFPTVIAVLITGSLVTNILIYVNMKKSKRKPVIVPTNDYNCYERHDLPEIPDAPELSTYDYIKA